MENVIQHLRSGPSFCYGLIHWLQGAALQFAWKPQPVLIQASGDGFPPGLEIPKFPNCSIQWPSIENTEEKKIYILHRIAALLAMQSYIRMREMTSRYETLTEPQRKVREKRRESPSGDRLPWQGWVHCKVDGEEEGPAPHCGGNKVAAELLPLQLRLAEDACLPLLSHFL